MSDTAAAPAAAPAASPTTPTAPDAGANPGAPVAAPTERKRINLAELGDDTDFVGIVDGKEEVMSASEYRRLLQQGRASTKAWQESKRMRNEVVGERRQIQAAQAELRDALANPAQFRAVLAEAGYSPREIAQAIIEADEAEARMSPEAKELRAIKAQQAEMQRRAQEQQRIEYQRQTEAHLGQFRAIFDGVCDLGGIPKAPKVRAVIHDALADAALFVDQQIRTGQRQHKMSEAEAVQIARNVYRDYATEYAGAIDEDAILSRLTPEMVQKYHAKNPPKPQSVQAAPSQPDLPRDRHGRFTEPYRAANVDVNGRKTQYRDVFEALGSRR
jgi:hypothetical protein